MGQANHEDKTLNLVNIQLLKKIGGGNPWEIALRDKGAGQACKLFKDICLVEQVHLIPTCEKAGQEGGRPIWLSKDLLVKLKCKK